MHITMQVAVISTIISIPLAVKSSNKNSSTKPLACFNSSNAQACLALVITGPASYKLGHALVQ
jgi:hypothetical protein